MPRFTKAHYTELAAVHQKLWKAAQDRDESYKLGLGDALHAESRMLEQDNPKFNIMTFVAAARKL